MYCINLTSPPREYPQFRIYVIFFRNYNHRPTFCSR